MEAPSVGWAKRKREPSPAPESSKRVKEAECFPDPEAIHRPPRLSMTFDSVQEPVTMKDLTELLQFAALGNKNGLKSPSWLRLHHQKRLSGVNVVILDGLTQAHFYRHYLLFRHLRTKYSNRRSYTPSPGNVITGFFSSEVLGTKNVVLGDKQKPGPEEALMWHPVIRKFGLKTRGLTGYLLTEEEMIKKHFPVYGMPGSEGFVRTDSADSVTDCSPLYGLDCEMCLTKKGNELTRVSLVDSRGVCVLDELVKPPNHILHYLTEFSGITAAMLEPITTTLREVQSKLKNVLPRDAVLVGHSLNCDLNALKLIHRHVIDTSLLYRREFGQRFKLKVLAETVLQKEIQMETRRGHDPTEDARAALELAQFFIRTGPRQVVELFCEPLWGGCLTMYQRPVNPSIHNTKKNNHCRFDEALKISGHSAVFIGKRSDISLALANQQWHSSDKEVLSSFKRVLASHSFSVVQFSAFSDHLKSVQSLQQQYHTMSARLRAMCVVSAGPFPSDYTEKRVRKLFSRCGAVRCVRLLNEAQGLQAEVEFDVLEGAALAVDRLSGTEILPGHVIEVQRPVNESMLDPEMFLSSLQDDQQNANVIYIAGLKAKAKTTKVNGTFLKTNTDTTAKVAELPAKIKGVLPPAKANHSVLLAKLNGTLLQTEAKLTEATNTGLHSRFAKLAELSTEVNGTLLKAKALLAKITADTNEAKLEDNSTGLSEQDLREAFGQYGKVKGVILPAKPTGQQKRRRHAFIKYYQPDAVEKVISTPIRLWDQEVSTCRALTPPHLRSWSSMVAMVMGHDETLEAPSHQTGSEEQEVDSVMRKLDRHMGKLFRSLPENTLSVVLLPGYTSCQGDNLPGLCLLEVKRG
ncbi:hypothetical protein UPYG_G00055170 [Umbra pygmaea]|uniref:RRM domain-containing protein n=1 Tax=Umbra pygmaea TaxID=75934 RepID=A0ABD0X827_UMBPY